jgi:hypothetical protein
MTFLRQNIFASIIVIGVGVLLAGFVRSYAAESQSTLPTDSVADFSGTQNSKGWVYGFVNTVDGPNAVQPMGQFKSNTWFVEDGRYWTSVGPELMHPNGKITTEGRDGWEQTAVRRWVSNYAGKIHVTGTDWDFQPVDPKSGADGVGFAIKVDGEQLYGHFIAEGDSTHFTFDFTAEVEVGSTVDFMVISGPNDWTDTISMTAKISKSGGKLPLDLLLHGIGKAGDSVRPGEAGGGNPNPKHPERDLKVDLYDAQDQKLSSTVGKVKFNSQSGSFKGLIDVDDLAAGSYVKVKFTQSLEKQINGIQNISSSSALPQQSVVTGDVNNDGAATPDVLDYGIIISCYGVTTSSEDCTQDDRVQADLDDNNKVDQFDYNLFMRELGN